MTPLKRYERINTPRRSSNTRWGMRHGTGCGQVQRFGRFQKTGYRHVESGGDPLQVP